MLLYTHMRNYALNVTIFNLILKDIENIQRVFTIKSRDQTISIQIFIRVH